jgi:coenzyme F420-reducing hydrogenase alpha subunit
MKIDLNIDLHHLARVEGHGDIRVRVRNGRLEEASWEIVETPRFFEAILKGKHFTSAGILTARICGICSIGHCLASVRATEAAFGIEVPVAAAKLRLLAKHGETLQSHLLHLFFLAAPDFLGQGSVLPLIESRPEVVQLALRLRGLANRLCDAVAGRTTHPVSIQVGGVAVMPASERLHGLRDELQRSLADLEAAAELLSSFQIPDFSRETEFVSLKAENDYPFIGGKLRSSDGVEREERQYLEMTNEYVVPNNTSKWCKLSRESFAVGALSRFNNSHSFLHPRALEVAEELGLRPGCFNPFMNNIAQLVESVHCTHDSIRLIEELTLAEPGPTMAPVEPRAGLGVAAVEVPRGILYHCLEYDGDGRIERADCVIPTTQNNANIHHDLRALVEQSLERGVSDEELELLCAMLVRSYDPCISCSVH